MKNVMTRAWEIAKEGAKKFGGKVKEYFAQALVMAWAEIKKGVNKMNFTEIFNAVKKDADQKANEFFKKYVQAMIDRKVNVQSLTDKSAIMIAPNGAAVDVYVLCEQDSWTDGVATFKSSIFIKTDKGQTKVVNSTEFKFNEVDYKK